MRLGKFNVLFILILSAVTITAAGCFYDTEGEPADVVNIGDGGIGTPCSADEDCVDLEADACTASDFDPNGYCTFADCEVGECPEPYSCCDCSTDVNIAAIFCADPDDTTLLTSNQVDCSCD